MYVCGRVSWGARRDSEDGGSRSGARAVESTCRLEVGERLPSCPSCLGLERGREEREREGRFDASARQQASFERGSVREGIDLSAFGVLFFELAESKTLGTEQLEASDEENLSGEGESKECHVLRVRVEVLWNVERLAVPKSSLLVRAEQKGKQRAQWWQNERAEGGAEGISEAKVIRNETRSMRQYNVIWRIEWLYVTVQSMILCDVKVS